jgi:hypothetical protein
MTNTARMAILVLLGSVVIVAAAVSAGYIFSGG